MSEPFCESCGARSSAGAKFCRGCGRELAAVPAPPGAEGSPPLDATRSGIVIDAHPVPREIRAAFLPAYELQRLLGRGGMGVVWLAREVSLDRPVALKTLGRDARDTPGSEARERFLREARLAARLRHRNIVPIHAVGTGQGMDFFTMGYIEGETLADRVLRAGPIPPAEAARILLDACEAVAHAHREGILHRDLKPANVMLDHGGHVFVLDFGLASCAADAGLTASGVVHGTPEYLAPEQAEGEAATARSDIHALGHAWFYLLAGRQLVRGESIGAVIAQHLTADLKARVLAEPLVPASSQPLLLRMIARDPSRRPGSVAEILPELRALAHGGGPGAAAAPGATLPTAELPLTPRASDADARDPAVAPPLPLLPPLPPRPLPPDAAKSPPRGSSPPGRRTREQLERLLDQLGKDEPKKE
jgi:serine/threonine-protein kinase